MSQQAPVSAVVNNDLKFNVAITYESAPLILEPYTLKVVLKTSASTPDSAGLTFEEGSGLTVTYPSEFTWVIPRADNTTAGQLWYRVDIIDGSGDVATALYGNFTVIAA